MHKIQLAIEKHRVLEISEAARTVMSLNGSKEHEFIHNAICTLIAWKLENYSDYSFLYIQ